MLKATRAQCVCAAPGEMPFKPNFVVYDAMMADFREQLNTDKIYNLTRKASRSYPDFIKVMIRFDIDNAVFG